MSLFQILIALGSFQILIAGIPKVPKFPDQYRVDGVISLPYPQIVEPFHAFYDKTLNRSRIDYYNGNMKTEQYSNYEPYGMGKVVAYVSSNSTLNVLYCFVVPGASSHLMTIQSVIPDLLNYHYSGAEKCPEMYDEHKNKECQVWARDDYNYQRRSSFTMWVRQSEDGKQLIPVRYKAVGFDYMFHSQFEKYSLDYKNYTAGSFDVRDLNIKPKGVSCDSSLWNASEKIHIYNPIKEFVENYQEHIDKGFEEFKEKHEKNYRSKEEHNQKKDHFRQNFRYIHSKNRQKLSFTLGVNHMADWSDDELASLNGRILKKDTTRQNSFENTHSGYLPKYMDWRDYGAVTPVKDQAICGGCWSFGSTGHLEGQYFLKTGNLVRLSEQQLIDCSWGQGNFGCNGGLSSEAYQYLMENSGIETEDTYGRYLGADGKCHHNKSLSAVKVADHGNVQSYNVTALQYEIYKRGPISVGIDGAIKSFIFYVSGVFNDPQCEKDLEELNHEVLAIGFGEIDGEPYWLVKNSWGSYWGEDGYVLISRKGNTCGVTTDADYAILA